MFGAPVSSNEAARAHASDAFCSSYGALSSSLDVAFGLNFPDSFCRALSQNLSNLASSYPVHRHLDRGARTVTLYAHVVESLVWLFGDAAYNLSTIGPRVRLA